MTRVVGVVGTQSTHYLLTGRPFMVMDDLKH